MFGLRCKNLQGVSLVLFIKCYLFSGDVRLYPWYICFVSFYKEKYIRNFSSWVCGWKNRERERDGIKEEN